MLVGNNESERWLAEFDPGTGRLEEFERSEKQRRNRPRIFGHYSKDLRGHVCVLYRDDGALRLWVDGKITDIDDNTTAALARENGIHTLKIARAGQEIFSFRYEAPIIDPPLALDPTPFIGEEDFDFGVFVLFVLNNPRRRREIYTDAPP